MYKVQERMVNFTANDIRSPISLLKETMDKVHVQGKKVLGELKNLSPVTKKILGTAAILSILTIGISLHYSSCIGSISTVSYLKEFAKKLETTGDIKSAEKVFMAGLQEIYLLSPSCHPYALLLL